MTPERWRRIDDLFDSALGVDPARREEWLRESCDDDALRAEVSLLLARDEQATRDGFLTPPASLPGFSDATASWPRGERHRPSNGLNAEAPPRPRSRFVADSAGFTPKAAIARGRETQTSPEARALVQARLRELPLIYVLIYGIFITWRHLIMGNVDPTISILNAALIVVLGGFSLALWGKRQFSLGRLHALEVGMFALLAAMLSFSLDRSLLRVSLRGDPVAGQMVIKNAMSLASILILTCGIYVPKTWRRAALLTGPIAVLPFATILVLYLQNPKALHWLGGWREQQPTPLALLGLDAMLLSILAVGSAYGANTISRLRTQVAEARQIGQYRLQRRIGAGGMGEVYLAEHQLLKRPCALKLIRQGDQADPKALERFEREVCLTATLSHPNTVEIYDYGRTEDGTYYYVMEYLPGLSLGEMVERHGPLPPGRVVYLLRQVCLALREAHDAGLIHRDVKPSNIFAARRGGMDDVAKLLDFGLVRPSAMVRAPSQSVEGQILGTPLFMSPEQAMGGRELDQRSDIYSLGAVAYYLLTGRPPFDEASGIHVMIAHARDPVVPPSQIRAEVPADLDQVVMRCLAKSTGDRYADAESLEQALGASACAGEWDQKRASRWWREVDAVVPA